MTYEIKGGDTLSGIAARSGVTVEALLRANPSVSDPNLIYAGEQLVIPDSTSPATDYATLISEAMDQSDAASSDIGASDGDTLGESCTNCSPSPAISPGPLDTPLIDDKSSVLDLKPVTKPEDVTEFGKSFKEKTGLELSESIRLYEESTGEKLTPEEVETLFTTTWTANADLINNEKLHKTYRDILNSQVPATEAGAIEQGYTKLSHAKSRYHDPDNNWKYVSSDGHREGVYNKITGKLVSSDEFKGTFNFFGPDNYWGHFANDVHPYWVHGN